MLGFGDLYAAIGPVLDPRFDLVETEDRFTLLADLPGITKEGLDIELHGQALTVVGERELESAPGPAHYLVTERSCGTFCRTFDLPAEVAGQAAEVSFQNGVLRVEVPKLAVQAGGAGTWGCRA